MDKNYYQGCEGHIDPREIQNFDFNKSVYLIEQKYDGIYAQLYFDLTGKLTIYSRNMKVKDNDQLESLRLYIEKTLKLKDSVIVGELAFSTQAGTEYQHKYGHSKVDIFDILRYESKELSTINLLERKALLDNICKTAQINKEYIAVSGYMISNLVGENFKRHVEDWFTKIVKDGGEGLIVKDTADTSYNFGGKSKLWYKIKKLVSMDYVIIGYEDSTSEKYGSQAWIKNILCGLYENGALVQKVKVGSMTEQVRKLLSENKTSYMNTVIEVAGFEIFKSGSTRHPSFLRFRDDKDAKDCTWNAK